MSNNSLSQIAHVTRENSNKMQEKLLKEQIQHCCKQILKDSDKGKFSTLCPYPGHTKFRQMFISKFKSLGSDVEIFASGAYISWD